MSRAIEPISNDEFRATEVGLVVAGNPTYAQWESYGRLLGKVAKAYKWAWGDWLVLGEQKWGEKYAQAIDETDWEYNTLNGARWVCKKVEFVRRRTNLTFEHHKEVAKFDADGQDEWLNKAEANGWDVKELRAAIRLARLTPKTLNLNVKPLLYWGDMRRVLPKIGQFDLIVTDPPYGVSANFDSQQDLEWDGFVDFLADVEEWLTLMKGALKPEFNLFWFCSAQWAADIEMLFRKLELPIRSRIAWEHRSLPKGGKATGKFLSTWDMILHAGNRDLNFPPEWSDAWFDTQHFEIPLSTGKGIDAKVHETQKPSGLIERLVAFGSFPGDRVLDPFAGSGTVGAVCPTDRNCVLIEKEDRYCKAIETRLGIERVE